MMKLKYFWSILLTGAFLALLVLVYGNFQTTTDYPNQPIKIIAHSNPGSGIDLMSRQVAAIAREQFNVIMVVENRPGTQGMVAMRQVLASPRDGYTVLAVTKSFLSTLLVNKTDVTLADFQFIAHMMRDAEALIINKQAKVNTFTKLLEAAQDEAGEQAWIGPGVGGRDHLMALKAWDILGIKAKWRNYKNAPQSVLALMRQEAPVYIGNPLDIAGKPQLGLAIIAGKERLAAYPEVPTFLELGYNLEEYMWRGLAVAKGTGLKERTYLEDIFKKISQTTQWQEYIRDNHAYPDFIGYADFQKQVAEEVEDTIYYLKKGGLMQDYRQTPPLAYGLALLLIILVVTLLTIIWRIILATRKISAVVLPLSLIGFAVFLFYETLFYQIPDHLNITHPATIPRVFIVLLITACTYILYQQYKLPNSQRPNDQQSSASLAPIIGWVTLYLCLILGIGYYLSTFIFLLGLILYNYQSFAYQHFNRALAVAVGFNWFSYLLFSQILGVQLPLGSIF